MVGFLSKQGRKESTMTAVKTELRSPLARVGGGGLYSVTLLH